MDTTADETGYLSKAYAACLADLGEPVHMEAAGAWWLRRPVPGTALDDGAGPYPLLCCRDWDALPGEIDALARRIVSFTAVCDPLAERDPSLLQRCFPDWLVPFKRHYVVELHGRRAEFGNAHHRRRARSALRCVEVLVGSADRDVEGDWLRLYGELSRRHHIRGAAAFTADSLRRQLRVPGVQVFRALVGPTTVAMQLWVQHGEHAYYHLGASDATGYQLGASHGIVATALEHFRRSGVRVADLGGVAGTADTGDSGLARFKEGWATGSRIAYLGGRILDGQAYEALGPARESDDVRFFPRYRAP